MSGRTRVRIPESLGGFPTQLSEPPPARRQHDDRDRWARFTRRIAAADSTEEVAHALLEEAVGAFALTCAAVYLPAGDVPGYRLSASWGPVRFAPALDAAALGGSSALPARLLRRLTAPPVSSLLAVPLVWRTMKLGLLVVGPETGGPQPAMLDLDLLRTIAAQAAVAVRVASLPIPASAAVVAHDLKNSISALSLLAANATEHFADPEFQRDALATVARVVDRIRRVLDAFAPSACGDTAVRAGAIDLRDVVLEATRALALNGRIRLVRRLQPVPAVYGDRDALTRVVENLATNAMESIEGEGTVTVTVAEEDGHAVIAVVDTGCGISEEYLHHHLFSPFRSTKETGWGVGLYHTRLAVEQQGGRIFVDSVKGRGTTFTVKLPVAPAGTAAREIPR